MKTLQEHLINARNGNVASIGWNSPNELASASWDKTKCGKTTLIFDTLPVNGLLVCDFSDRFVRLYDTCLQGLLDFILKNKLYYFN
ncbi:unnamed protein product [Rotaria sp. Silwood2]|nr:unnamed protein product [Rotaria sp. Silwood2]CAF3173135.1 unnamed protein product [Rotaria sp. Silwood2]CAF3429329.1 unnamed protein product [Rotaria sp. Silwood2]CAF4259779.1 unnamed protein product [Rotaria sp. Silwood2]CAF4579398.1 unnamed protein product [Rotaria sp. Silwood2]